MDMGIVNAGQLAVYESIEPELREACEDVVLNRRATTPPSACSTIAERFKGAAGKEAKERDLAWRERPVEQAHRACAGQRHHRIHRRRHRGGAARRRAAAACHRRPADGRHERRRRPVRRRQDVPAAGGEVGPRDEAGGRRICCPTWRPRRSPTAAPAGAQTRRQDPDGDGQGRRPRHRQEHRRRRARLQQLRDHRSRRHGAGGQDPADGAATRRSTSSACPA